MTRLQFAAMGVLWSFAGLAAPAAGLDLAPRQGPEADGEEIVDYDRDQVLEAMKRRPVAEGLRLRQVPEGLQVPVLGLVQFPFPPSLQKTPAFEPKFLAAKDSSGKPDPYTYVLRYEGPVTFLIVGTRRVKLIDVVEPNGAGQTPPVGAEVAEINPSAGREEGGDVATIDITLAKLPYTIEVTCDRKTASTCKSRDALKKLVEKLGFAYVPQ